MNGALSMIASIGLATVIFGTVWWLAGPLLALCYRCFRPLLARVSARARLRSLTVISALPLMLGCLVTILLFVPAGGGLLVSDHCHESIGCYAHTPAIGNKTVAGVLPILALLMVFAALARVLTLVQAHRRRLRVLEQVAQPAANGDYWLIDCDLPFAITTGLLRQKIFVSTGLGVQLTTQQFDSVLTHEQAHARRFDNLRTTLVSLLAPARLAGDNTPLSRAMRLAAEECCDLEAARVVNDPLLVADTLIYTQRACGVVHTGKEAPRGDRFGGLPERVARLIEGPLPSAKSSPVLIVGVCSVAILFALLGVNALHHSAEALLALFQR